MVSPACRWNGGGSFRGREWSEKLPTDAEIAMHCVAAYFDSSLPPAHGVVDGRTFRYVQCSPLKRSTFCPAKNELISILNHFSTLFSN